MTNINKNSFFALNIPLESYAESKPITNFSLNGSNPFSISINFYADHIDHSVSLFKQTGSIDIGIDKDLLYYASPSSDIFSASITIPDKMWNVFDIVYDTKEISFYLNGFLCFQKEVTSTASPTISTENYIIGKNLGGYLRFIKIFNYSLTKNEIIENQYENTIAKEKTELYFDFSLLNPIDRGKNNIVILYDENCNPKNIVKTISFNENGFAIPLKSTNVNPGGFASGEYTILSKVYIWPSKNEKTVIFTNGNMNSENSVTLGVLNDWDTEETKIFLKMGKNILVSTSTVPIYQWVDIACGYSSTNKSVKLYIDGIMVLEQSLTEVFTPLPEGNVVIGNTLNEGIPENGTAFNGYIDYISVFDKSLLAATLQAFINTPAFIYDNNIIALYKFNSDNIYDIISKTSVSLSSGAVIIIAQNTVYSDSIPELNYNYTNIPKQYSDFEVWQANVLGFVFTEFITEETGVIPTTGFLDVTTKAVLNVPVANLIIREILPLKESQEIIKSYQLIQKDKMLEFLKRLKSKGLLDNLVKTFYSKSLSFLPTSISTASTSVLSSSIAPYIAITIPILLAPIVVKVAEKTKKDPPPPYVPPLDSTIKYRSLKVDKITFNHNKDNYVLSATNIRLNTKEEVPIPEWNSTFNNISGKESQAAYIKSKVGDAFIKVTFYYNTNYTDTFNTEISGKCIGDNILGDIPGVKVNFSTPGYYTIDFKLSNNNFSKKEIGSYIDQINWTWDYIYSFVGTSFHSIYLISDIPIDPWSIKAGDTNKYPTVESLKFYSNALKKTSLALDSNITVFESLESVTSRLTTNMFTDKKFKYNTAGAGEPVYSLLLEDSLTFDREKFYTDIHAGGDILVNSLDCALIIADGCREQGYNPNIVAVKSGLEPYWNEQYHQYFDVPLTFQSVKLIGDINFGPLQDIDSHFFVANITGSARNTKTLVYDGCIRTLAIDGTEIIATNLPFSSIENETVGIKDNHFYRESFFDVGSSCVIREIIDSWQNGTIETSKDIYEKYNSMFLQPEDLNRSEIINNLQVDSIKLDDSGTHLVPAGRTEQFDALVTNYSKLTLPDFLARCHSISYDTLCDGIIHPINKFIDLEYTQAKLIKYLNGLQNASFPNGKSVFVGELKDHISFYEGATVARDKIIELLINKQPLKDLITPTNNFLNCLNNSVQNLRRGSGFWNSSVQSAFDPVSWCYVENKQVISSQEKLDVNLPLDTANLFPAGAPTKDVPDGFYLTDKTDGKRLYIIFNETRGSGKFHILLAKTKNADEARPFIFSSSNLFKFIPSSEYINLKPDKKFKSNIYYLYENQWIKFRFSNTSY